MAEQRKRPADIQEALDWLDHKANVSTSDRDIFQYRHVHYLLMSLSDRVLNDRRQKQRRKPITIKGN